MSRLADDEYKPKHCHPGRVNEADKIGKEVVVEIQQDEKSHETAAQINQLLAEIRVQAGAIGCAPDLNGACG